MADARGLVVAFLSPADQRPGVDPLSGEVLVDDALADLSPADLAALEYALRAAEAWECEVLAVAAGGPHVEPGLRVALAHGARALRVEVGAGPAAHKSPGGPRRCDGPELAGDPAGLAAAAAEAIAARGEPALVVCGESSSTDAAFAACLAHRLGAAQALGLVGLSFEPGGAAVAERRLDGGWRQMLRLSPPTVCSVEAAGVRLRRAPLNPALAAASASIPVHLHRPAAGPALRVGAPRPYRPRTKVVAPPSGATHDRVVSLTGALVTHEPPRVVGPLEPAEAAAELLGYLRRAGVTPDRP